MSLDYMNEEGGFFRHSSIKSKNCFDSLVLSSANVPPTSVSFLALFRASDTPIVCQTVLWSYSISMFVITIVWCQS